MMIYRKMFMGYSTSRDFRSKNHSEATILTISFWNDRVFLYMETTNPALHASDVVEGDLSPLPDGTLWTEMNDVFHYSYPQSEEHWKRESTIKEADIRINFLKPDMVSSYVFQHYRFQEECPGGGKGGHKYGIIFLLGNMIVMHLEPPYVKETSPGVGKLTTNDTPYAEWQDLMNSHFMGWDDSSEYWKRMDYKILKG